MALDRLIPGYWMNETSGALAPAVRAYLAGGPMTEAQIATMRAYCRQWIGGHGGSRVGSWFHGPEIDLLRLTVDSITTRRTLAEWLDLAEDAGVDPL